MNTYICIIVDDEGFTVEHFKHSQTSLQEAEKFERLILDAVRERDKAPRYVYGCPSTYNTQSED